MEEDLVILALTLYRECRGEPREGQIAVANVIANRAKKNNTSVYDECVKPLQFSSMTSRGDSQLVIWPHLANTAYMQCKNIAFAVVHTGLPDTTNGSTLYFNPKSLYQSKPLLLPTGEKTLMPLKWNAERMAFEARIGNHLFFREV